MEDVRDELQRLKQENHELERELRRECDCFNTPCICQPVPENSTAEQKARLLEKKVAENLETIAHLRQERNLINKDHKDLQQRYSEVCEVCSCPFLLNTAF